MMRRLPPLGALRVFEVAARSRSFAEAAAELGVTQGAVSQQIALLENWLGRKLFSRVGRRMAATPAARILAAEVGLSFDRLAVAAEACERPDARRILRVSAPTSFAMRWLIPRLDRFHAIQPDIEIVVGTVSTVVEELRGGFEVAIRRGTGRPDAWPEYHAVPVLETENTPIMSPALFARRPILRAADLAGHTLLGSETRAGEWASWMDAAGLGKLPDLPRRTFDHFFVARQAVEDGLGVGIGPLPMLSLDIARNRLMAPLPLIRATPTRFLALLPRRDDPGSVASRFVAWLAGQQHEPPPGDED
ncbi:LysR substrate-binding domain-containing protein [Acetobacteraceae bacterium KSS8]|uniref:LysR substrate-binding domain-containing protein n=1 Tax=Endosaccharibacter trunci TaxID=2812733 RepID=A0ABT1W2W4_9PROT|nr:LysR substrate-binding domain-containing protein [Acetobacteraceae bacterium KSS8]